MVLTNNDELAKKIRHISTTAKIRHTCEFEHDELGFNYRMSNLNASLGISQFNKIESYLSKKLRVYKQYKKIIESLNLKIITPPKITKANNWLNVVLMPNSEIKNEFIENCLAKNIFVRPVWKPLHTQKHMHSPLENKLENTMYLYNHAVCLPSSVPLN
jgi:dTDP-4-amino-4,6-dideoxygalactose transaminase